jgi:uncharacterized protein (PEP-CTERM system associated)
VFAQGASDNNLDLIENRNQRIWIEPRVTLGVNLSNNGSLSETNPKSDQIYQISPGVRAVFNDSRVRGFIDYSLDALLIAKDTAGDNTRQRLESSATVELVTSKLFVDMSGVIEDQLISAFGQQGVGSWADANRSETARFGISPYFRGRVADGVEGELRYNVLSTNTSDVDRSDVFLQGASFLLGSQDAGRLVGWSVDGSVQKIDYSLGRLTNSSALSGQLLLNLSPQLRAGFSTGVEVNDFLTPEKTSYLTNGVSIRWVPSTRTRVDLSYEKRYFGSGYNVSFEHRTARTLWKLSDSRGSTNDELEPGAASLGSLYDLLDSLYSVNEPDPIRRSQLVSAELVKIGLPANTQVFRDFVSSSAVLRRIQQASVALLGVRDVVTFSVTRESSRRLSSIVSFSGLGDDFDNNASIVQTGIGIAYSHRLSLLTSISAEVSQAKTVGDVEVVQIKAISFGITTRLGRRTNASVQVRRTVSDGTATPYSETNIAGFLTHRF